jgi:hypothetical protein
MCLGMITKAVGRIYQGKYKEVHSMLIFKDDKLVSADGTLNF